MTIPHGTETELLFDPADFKLGIYPMKYKLFYHKGTCTCMFITALFAIIKISAGHGGSHLQSQHFWRSRWGHHEVKKSNHPGQHGETPSLLKIQNLAGRPVVPATCEAEAGESLEPRRRRLQ